MFQRPLFPEKFQAWVRGPAIPEIYQRYQSYGWRNIDEEVKPPDLDTRIVAFMEEVLKEYGPLDARRLEQLTRHEDPWIEARPGIAEDEPSTATINEETMGVYYRQGLSEAELQDMLQEEERGTDAVVRTRSGHGPGPLLREQARTNRTAG